MTTLKASLKAARDAISSKDYETAIKHSQDAIKADDKSYEAHIFLGKAAFLAGNLDTAESAYKKATEINPNLALAWKGLVELYEQIGRLNELQHVLENLLPLLQKDSKEKQKEIYLKMSQNYASLNKKEEARKVLTDIPEDLFESDEDRLPIYCRIIDLQDEDKASDQDFLYLEFIHKNAPVSTRFSRYRGQWLQASFERLPPFEERQQWHEKAETLYNECLAQISINQGKHQTGESRLRSDCPEAYEIAIFLSDILESQNPNPSRNGNFKSSLELTYIRQYPGRNLAKIVLACQLHLHAQNKKSKPYSLKERARILQLISTDTLQKAGIFRGWSLAIDISLQNGHFEEAFLNTELTRKWMEAQKKSGLPVLHEDELTLEALRAEAKFQSGSIQEAKVLYKTLADKAKALSKTSSSSDILHKAMLGMAICAGKEQALDSAIRLCRHILSLPNITDILGIQVRLLLAENLVQKESLDEAKDILEIILPEMKGLGGRITDNELGRVHVLLGNVYYKLGGDFKASRNFAHKQWLSAASLLGKYQASAFTWLGVYYQEVSKDTFRAQKCWEKALMLDANQHIAGERLVILLKQKGDLEAATTLLQDLTESENPPDWIWAVFGRLLLSSSRTQEAVQALQTCLRTNKRNSDAWEALAFAYQTLNRLTAAIKAYGQATSLDPKKYYSWTQAGCIHLSMGSTDEAIYCFEQALETKPNFLPAMVHSSEALLLAANSHLKIGALGLASKELQEAKNKISLAVKQNGNSPTIWKLFGDIQSAQIHISPDANFIEGQDRVQIQVRQCTEAQRSYSKALHISPNSSTHWADLALALSMKEKADKPYHSNSHRSQTDLQECALNLLKGSLRIEPASPQLWYALGTTSNNKDVKQYAFIRALQLDPKHTASWVSLGRLYMENKEKNLAAQCLTNARSHDPTASIIWESMAKLAEHSSSGLEDKFEYLKHALQLSPTIEGLSEFVSASLTRNVANNPKVLVAACRCVAQNPLNSEFLYAKSLVYEARMDFDRALINIKLALKASRVGFAASQSREEYPVKIGGKFIHIGRDKANKDPEPELKGALEVATEPQLKVSLARLLYRSGDTKLSNRLFKQILGEPILREDAQNLLWYGRALLAENDLQEAKKILTLALNISSPQVFPEVLATLCVGLIKQNEANSGMNQLQSYYEKLVSKHVESKAALKCFLSMMSAFVEKKDVQNFISLQKMCHQYNVNSDDIGGEDLKAKEIMFSSLLREKCGHQIQAQRNALSAIHCNPGNIGVRILAAQFISKSPNPKISRKLLHRGSFLHRPPTENIESGMKDMALEIWAIASISEANSLSTEEKGFTTKVLRTWLHCNPQSAKAWVYLGLWQLYSQQENVNGSTLSALKLLKTAEKLLDKNGDEEHDKLYPMILLAEAECHTKLAHQGKEMSTNLKMARTILKKADAFQLTENQKYMSAIIDSRVTRISGDGKEFEDTIKNMLSGTKFSLEKKVRISLTDFTDCFGPEHNAEIDIKNLTLAIESLRKTLDECQADKKDSLRLPIQIALISGYLHVGDFVHADEIADSALGSLDSRNLSINNLVKIDTLKVLLGGLALLQSMHSQDDNPKHVSKARSNLVSASKSSFRDIKILAEALLAEMESLGSHKKKSERIENHVQQIKKLTVTISPQIFSFLTPLLQKKEED